MSPTVAILVSLAVVLANAFFVAAEFAFVKIRPTRIEQLANQGHRRARLLMGMLKRLNVYLSASQIGITVASLTLGWLGEPAIAKLLSPVMLDQWAPATGHGPHRRHRHQPGRHHLPAHGGG